MEIAVSDEGPGVPLEARDGIFDWGVHGNDSPGAGHRSQCRPPSGVRARRNADPGRAERGSRFVVHHPSARCASFGGRPCPRRPDTRPSTRVLIIEDHTLFAESLELALSLEGYDVRRLALPEVGGSMATLRSTALRSNARIVLLDLDLGRFGDGMGLIAPLARAGANVVVVTASTDHGRWGACVRQGARKVLSKGRPLQETLSTVRRLHQGLPVMTSDELERLLDAWRSERMVTDDMRRRLELLTPREKQVLGALIEGHNVREIARIGVVSEATVRTQVKSILGKLEVSSQLAAVGLAHHVGWQHTPARRSGVSGQIPQGYAAFAACRPGPAYLGSSHCSRVVGKGGTDGASHCAPCRRSGQRPAVAPHSAGRAPRPDRRRRTLAHSQQSVAPPGRRHHGQPLGTRDRDVGRSHCPACCPGRRGAGLAAVPGRQRLVLRRRPLGEPAGSRAGRVLRAGAGLGIACWLANVVVGEAAAPEMLVPVVAALTLAVLASGLMPLPGETATRIVLAGHPEDVRSAMAELATSRRYVVSAACVSAVPDSPAGRRCPVQVGVSYAADVTDRSGSDALLVLPGQGVTHATMRRLQWRADSAGVPLYIGTGLLDVVAHPGLGRAGRRTRRDAGARRRPPAARAAWPRTWSSDCWPPSPCSSSRRSCVLVWVLVRTETTGPGLFRQQRVGRNGVEFTMMKFRTMSMHRGRGAGRARPTSTRSRAVCSSRCAATRASLRSGRSCVATRSTRCRSCGTSSPGQMSLVGPRPALPQEVERYDLDPRRRLAVKPGITGLWQVSGRSDLSWAESVRLDVKYVDNWSLMLDVSILCRTVGAVLNHRGAY